MVSHRRILPLVTRLGGIELILTAMSRFCDDDWVLVTGWAALASWMYVERDMLVPVELLESVLSSVSPQAVAEALVKSDSADFDTEVVKFVEYGCACGVSNAVSVAMRSPIVNSNQRCVRSVVQCASAVAFTPLGASTLLKVAPVFIGAIRVREYGYLDPLPAALRALFWIAMHHPSAVPSWVANDALSRCGLVSQLKSVLDDAKQQLMNEGLENLSARPVVVSGLWLLFALTCQRDGRSALTRAGGAALFTPLVEVFPWDDDLQSLIRYVVQLLTLGVE